MHNTIYTDKHNNKTLRFISKRPYGYTGNKTKIEKSLYRVYRDLYGDHWMVRMVLTDDSSREYHNAQLISFEEQAEDYSPALNACNYRGMKTKFSRIPIGYLRWMVSVGHKLHKYAILEIQRRKAVLPIFEITGRALDRASLYCRDIWHHTRKNNEGIYTWLHRVVAEAQREMTLHPECIDDQNRIHYNGMIICMKNTETIWPVITTIMRDNQKTKGVPFVPKKIDLTHVILEETKILAPPVGEQSDSLFSKGPSLRRINRTIARSRRWNIPDQKRTRQPENGVDIYLNGKYKEDVTPNKLKRNTNIEINIDKKTGRLKREYQPIRDAYTSKTYKF